MGSSGYSHRTARADRTHDTQDALDNTRQETGGQLGDMSRTGRGVPEHAVVAMRQHGPARC